MDFTSQNHWSIFAGYRLLDLWPRIFHMSSLLVDWQVKSLKTIILVITSGLNLPNNKSAQNHYANAISPLRMELDHRLLLPFSPFDLEPQVPRWPGLLQSHPPVHHPWGPDFRSWERQRPSWRGAWVALSYGDMAITGKNHYESS